MKLFKFLIPLVILTATTSARDIDHKKYSSKLKGFIEDTVYRAEAGNRVRKFLPLPKSIALRFHCNDGEKALTLKKLEPMLEVAQVTVEETSNQPKKIVTIDIYFGNSAEMAASALKLDKQINVSRGFTYWKWFDNNFKVTGGVVFICTDKVKGATLERQLAKQLIHIMGMPSEGKADNSLLGEKNNTITKATELDLAILKFLYKSVPSGSSPSELKKILRKEWPNEKNKKGRK